MKSEPVSADGSGRIAGLDLVRAVAILGVIASHATLLGNRDDNVMGGATGVRLGGLGVDVFFALSGWLIGGQLYDGVRAGTFSVWAFWRRRWLRTVPAYLFFLGVTRIIYLRHRPGESLLDWRYLVYVQNLAWPHPLAFAEAWSLSVEEWFYLTAPLLLLLFCRAGSRSLGGFGAVAGILTMGSLMARGAAIAWHDLPLHGPGSVSSIVVLRLDAIAVGLAAVWLDREGFFDDQKIRHAVAGVGAAMFVAGIWWVSRANAGGRLDTGFATRLWIPLIFPLATALLLPVCSRLRSWPQRLSGWAVSKIALISYSMYLCNISVMQAAGKAGDLFGLSVGTQIGLFVALTLAVGFASYCWIERPFIRLYRREIADAIGMPAR